MESRDRRRDLGVGTVPTPRLGTCFGRNRCAQGGEEELREGDGWREPGRSTSCGRSGTRTTRLSTTGSPADTPSMSAGSDGPGDTKETELFRFATVARCLIVAGLPFYARIWEDAMAVPFTGLAAAAVPFRLFFVNGQTWFRRRFPRSGTVLLLPAPAFRPTSAPRFSCVTTSPGRARCAPFNDSWTLPDADSRHDTLLRSTTLESVASVGMCCQIRFLQVHVHGFHQKPAIS